MNRILRTLLPLLLAGALVAHAQGRRAPQGPAHPQQAGINMAALSVVEGTVADVDVTLGARYPTIVINQTQIKLAPAWYLLDNDMEIATGDRLKVTAAASADPADKYVYAVDITKGSAFLKLRDAAGVPLWIGGNGSRNEDRQGRGSRNGTGECEGCIDAASMTTATGMVDKIAAGAGIQFPTLVLKTSDGSLLTVKIGPERILLAGDFEIAAGQSLTVKYARSTCKDEFVAFELTDSAGRKIVLRNPDGTPAWN